MKRLICILVIVLFQSAGPGFAQHIESYALTATLPPVGLLSGSNDVDALLIADGNVWFGTGAGLSVLRNGTTTDQVTSADGLGKGSISALAWDNGVLWAATAFDSTTKDAGSQQVGGGLSYSLDEGQTWTHFPQPVDAKDDSLGGKKPTTVAVSNVTYDIAVRDGAVWIASFAGGLRKSTDNGLTWEVVTPDGLPFDVLNHLNHRAFSVISARNGLWVGTAGGINRSTDGGQQWTNFNHLSSGISGNFITALAEQVVDGRSLIWAATWQAEGETEFTAVSMSRNNGLTWDTSLPDERVHNFAFDGTDVYAVSDNGLFKSDDFGQSWYRFPPITAENGRILTEEYYSAAVDNGVLWVGTKDGIARTEDGGKTWEVSRTFERTGAGGGIATYAYPNPFSPLRHNVVGDDGYVRIQYNTRETATVTLRIFDFAMQKVRTVVHGETRSGGRDFSELWDGVDDTGHMVHNGVYFYRLDLAPGGTYWGKIVVLN